MRVLQYAFANVSHTMTKQYYHSSCSCPIQPRLGRFDELFTPNFAELGNTCTEIMMLLQNGTKLLQHEW